MNIQDVIATINRMQADGVINRYAIGGAVGATFYLEPIATLDVDVFVAFQSSPGSALLDPSPLSSYLSARGCMMQGEYVMIANWPVQFLRPAGSLGDEALTQAVEEDAGRIPARVFTVEHLAAIALQTGRAKDKARLLQFVEAGVLDAGRFQAIVVRHGLEEKWRHFEQQFFAGPS